MTVFARVHPQTLEAWEYGFRCDTHPWGEIALWELMADAFETFTGHITGLDELSDQKRRDVFRVVHACSMLPKDHTPKLCKQFGTLTGNRVKAIFEWFRSDANCAKTCERRNRLRTLIAPHRLPGPDRVPVEALFDEPGTGPNLAAEFNPRELIESADVILGVNVADQREFLLYGRDALARIVASGQSAQLTVLRIELDQQTDNLERIVALVQMLKGRHDYQAG